MMKVLYLTKYSRNAGSSRLRSYQYFPFLESQGLQIEVSPLFSEQYLQNLYSGRSTKKEALKGYVRRFFKLLMVRKYDKLVVEKELFPYLPAWGERFLKVFGVKYIVDYDDAIFHNYDQHPNQWIRKFLGNKIDRVIKASGTVIAGNGYLASRARLAGAKRVEIIPTVIDLQRYPKKVWKEERKQLIVGWIGTQSTFNKHFMLLANQVQKLTAENPDIFFHIIGAPDNKLFNEQVRFISWSEESEVEEILKFDLGLMPLVDSNWEKGKCAYKLIQYMACGIPGMASDVGVNRELIHTENGYLLTSTADFEAAILRVHQQFGELERKGAIARKTVENTYTLQVQAPKLYHIIKS